MMLIMLGFGGASLRWAERLPVGDGLGWDGVNYGAWAKDYHKAVFVDKVEDYYVQRVAPSGFVHYGARAVLRPFYSHNETLRILSQNKNILLAFGIYNLILVLLTVHLWGEVANILRISERGKWFGFCFLFINYAILKANFYAPVSNDMSGFTLGMLMFYCFLKRNSWGLLAIMVLGGFSWPLIPPTAALLLAFPRPIKQTPPAESSITGAKRKAGLVASLTACVLVILVFVYLFKQDIPRQWHVGELARIDFTLLYSSIAAVLVYLFFGVRGLFMDGRLLDFRFILGAIQWKWAAAAVITILVLRYTVPMLASATPSSWSYRALMIYVFISALTEPFIFVVSHTVYYGPIILLLLIFWRPFCESAGNLGIGFQLFVLLNLVLSICPQSRFQISAIGPFVMVMVMVIDRVGLRQWHLELWILLSLFFSKIWYTFNTSPMNPDGSMAIFHTFPLQNLFMNFGPWMSKSMYLVQGSVVFLTAISLYIATRGNTSRSFLSTKPAAIV